MTQSKNKKSKGSKSPEDLTALLTSGYSTGPIKNSISGLLADHIIKTNTIDEQILGIRYLISIASRTNDGKDGNTPYDEETIEKLADLIIYLFFQLKSNSCLKSVIANSINKVDKSKSGADILLISFCKYVENVIQTMKSSITHCDSTLALPLEVMEGKTFEDFISCVSRSLENNCNVSALATKRNITIIADLIETICLIPISEHIESEMEKHKNNSGQQLLGLVSRVIRLTLSLQSLSREKLSSTFINTLMNFQTFYYFILKSTM